MTTVLMVSGSWPPQVCGVGDYTEMLCRELEQHAVSVVRFASDRFSGFIAPQIVREVGNITCDLVHIQYPTAGYRRSLTPSMLARNLRGKPVLVTFHEYSVFRWYRHPWFSPFARHCAARVFTTDDERELFARRFPARGGLDRTIEIASNIPVSTNGERQPASVCYFGLIAPNKGIEAFIDLAVLAGSNANGLTFELIGAAPERHRRYAEQILKRAAASGIKLSLQLPETAVADRLVKSTFAYLPFPDGASARRGTLVAAIVNGVIVVTPHSRITPEWIRSATLEAKTPSEALGLIARLRSDSRLYADMKVRIARAAGRFRWDDIARRHIELYRQLLNLPVRHEPDRHREAPQCRRQSRLAS